LKIDDAPNGIFEVYINGINRINFTGDTKPGADTTVNNIQIHGLSNASTFYDDLALNDTTGVSDNSYCGDGHYVIMYPNGAGTTNDFSNSGSTAGSNNYTYGDDFPSDGDTTYVYSSSSSVGQQDQYTLSDYALGGVVKKIYAECRARKTTTDENYIKIGYLPNGGTDQLSGSIPLSTNYERHIGTSASANPITGLAWTTADLNALEYVIEKA